MVGERQEDFSIVSFTLGEGDKVTGLIPGLGEMREPARKREVRDS
jgi:hypothetical protein